MMYFTCVEKFYLLCNGIFETFQEKIIKNSKRVSAIKEINEGLLAEFYHYNSIPSTLSGTGKI